MENILSALALDKWYKIIIWFSVFLIISSFQFEIEFLENKHLFGLGFGLFLLGISFVMASVDKSWFKPPNAYTGPAALITQSFIEFGIFSGIVFILGILLSLFFLFMIFKSLI